MTGVTLDAGPLIALDRDDRRVIALLVRQPNTKVVPLDAADATQVGILLGRSGTRDLADAHVVICARRNGDKIVTSDAQDLVKLDPAARLVEL